MVQTAKPTSDDSNSGWLNSNENTTDVWSYVDGTAPDTGTYMHSDSSPTSSELILFGIQSLTDPAVSTGHVLRPYLAKDATGGKDITFTIQLLEGASIRKSYTAVPTSTSYAQFSSTLSAAEADAITDYTSLQIRIWCESGGGGAPREGRCSYVAFEVPDAPAGFVHSIIPAVIG